MFAHSMIRLCHFQFRMAMLPGLTLFLFSILSVRASEPITNENLQMQMETADPYSSPTNGLGSWIWAEKTDDNQTCQLWNAVEIPKDGKVRKARLVVTADNEFTLFVDGRELGRGVEWRELYVFDLTTLLPPGRHVLAVRCYNGVFAAGMLCGMRADLADGRTIEIKSDETWRIVPEGVRHWEKRTEAQPNWPAATVIAPLGGNPWLWRMPEAVIMMPSLQPVKIFFWQTGWFQISLLSVCGLVIVISLRLMAQLALHRKERYLLQGERARIARDIHDDIGSRMTQLVLRGEVAQNELPVDSEMRHELDCICEEARGLLSTMDEILWAVNPQRDTLRDFAAYVCKYATDFLKPTQIQCLFEVGSEMSTAAFELPLRRSLLMAIKETLNNAVKHSAATELHLQIQWQGQQLIVVVQDNGKGFDPKIIKSERNGLTNMVQRMNEVGGYCSITTESGKGTRVEFGVPLKSQRSNVWNLLWKTKKHQPTSFKPGSSASLQDHDATKC
jgi:signal transduction histidine kinase